MAGCANEPGADQKAKIVAHQVVSSLVDSGVSDISGIKADDQNLESIEVYVDRSLSMQPYAIRNNGNMLRELLVRLDDFIASHVSFYGFGFVDDEDEQQTVERVRAIEMHRPGSYTYANNDYATLFETFDHDSVTRIVITDGVQSDPTDGARLASVAEALHNWVTNGGTFAIFLYRTPYHGQYFSDLTERDPQYSCEDRPLLLFVLAPSSSAVDNLMTRLGQGLEPKHVVRIGAQDVDVKPVGETLTENEEERGTRVMRDINTLYVPGFSRIFDVRIDDRSGSGSSGFVPLQFEARALLSEWPWDALGEEGSQKFLRHLQPEIIAWSVNRGALRRQDTTAAGEHVQVLQPATVSIRDLPDPEVTLTGDSLIARFTVPMRKPDGGAQGQFALVFQLTPTESNARSLIPPEFSTPDDVSPSNCNRILKLNRLIGAIMLRNYIPGQVLMLADWR